MSNTHELVKWKPPISDAGRKIDAALARIRNGVRIAEVLPPRRKEIAPEVCDLQRVCSVHGKPYAARYVRQNGRYRYAQSIRITRSLYEVQYAESERLLVDSGFVCEETCAWCGASGFAAVRCSACGADACYGMTVGKYFRCSCGHEGKITTANIKQVGMRPCAQSEDTRLGG
jgi:hypothetical protein